MKRLLFLLAFFAFVFNVKAQVVLYEDDFEAYTVGATLVSQNPAWAVWPGGTSGVISTDVAHSGAKSVYVSSDNDLIYAMGNKVSGKYQVDFYYYVPTGFGGYFNFQRHESPGVEWIIEVYFGNDGNGFIHAGGENAATFNFQLNSWTFVKTIIDLDSDWAEFYINGNLVHQWQWSYTSQGAVSPYGAQLGCVNIYAGAPTGQTAKFYFDDFYWVELTAGNNPAIAITPTQFQKNLTAGQVVTDNLNVQNVGTAPLDYGLQVNYVFDKGNPVLDAPEFNSTIKNPAGNFVVDPNPRPSADPANPTDEVILNYDGPNYTAIGLNNPNQWEVAAKFTNDMTVPYAGMMLTKVDVYIKETDGCSFKLRIYGEGSAIEPGALLHEQEFYPIMPEWLSITLTNPIIVTGEELWVGYWIDQTIGSTYPAGADEGPAHPHGDYIKTGAGWGHLSSNASLDYNWNIRGVLEGTAGPSWLSLTPTAGTLQPSASTNHTVTFDASLLNQGAYNAVIKAVSNDVSNPVVNIPVSVNISGSSQEPTISVNPMSLTQELLVGQTATKQVNVANVGQLPLNYNVAIEFLSMDGAAIQPVPEGKTESFDIDLSLAPTPTAGGNPVNMIETDPVVLNYDGENNDAIGLTSGGTFHVAARFPSAMTTPYQFYMLESVDIYINDVPSTTIVKIWGPGTSTSPGTLLQQKVITPTSDSWNTVTLSTPIEITGTDIWIGYTVTHAASQYPAGCDAGPHHPSGDGSWISTDGASWSRLYEIADLNYNWNIRGNLFPGVVPWLSVSPTSGTVPGGSSNMLNVVFNSTSTNVGVYNANLKIGSNDPATPMVTVPVQLNVTGTPSGPSITVDPTSISAVLPLGQSGSETLTVGNVGMQTLNFSVNIAYPDQKSRPVKTVPVGEVSHFELDLAKTPAGTNGGSPKPDNTDNPVILHYDGENSDAIGLTNGGTMYMAARFPSAMVGQYAYYTLETVSVYINDAPTATTVRIWSAGTSTAPGTLIHQQNFTPVANSWNTITLTTPVTLDGNDIWIGYNLTHQAGEFSAGCDNGPANPDGAWISTNGSSWSRLYELAPTLDYNWNIRGTIHPGVAPWITVNPLAGSVAAGGSMPLTVNFNGVNLTFGTYNADIILSSNDPSNPTTVVPVELIIEGTPEFPNIVVTPEQLSVEMLPETTESKSLTIANTGDANLEYSTSIQYLAAGDSDAFVYFEGFEGAVFPPAGWTRLNPVPGSGWTDISAGTTPLPGWTGGTADPAPDGGSKMTYCTWTTGGDVANDQWLVTKQFTMVEGMELSFWLRYWPNSYIDHVQIKISKTVQNNVNAFTILVDDLNFTSASPITWQLYTYDLDEFLQPGESFYVAFREFVADNNSDGAVIFLDNVGLSVSYDWLNIDPEAGNIAPNGHKEHTVNFNNAGLALGNYTANIVITSNDPDAPTTIVPVSMSVVDVIITPGDANGDGVVNTNDVVTMISYILFGNPEPFFFENADINGDGNIDVVDAVATIYIILGAKNESSNVISAPGSIYLNPNSIELQSDGTLAGLQFELAGIQMNQLKLALDGYEFVGAVKDGVLRGLVFSFDNTPIPAGMVTLFNINSELNPSWGDVFAANVNSEKVDVFKYTNGFENEFVLSVFPNPAKESISVKSNKSISLIRLTNQLGQVVEEGTPQVEMMTITTSGLRKGIYILEVHTDNNVSVQKIVIE